jgi:predicted Zn-dependent peptidase
MSRLATQEFYFGRQIASEDILERIGKVSLETLQQSIREYAGPSGPEVAVACLGGDGVQDRLERILDRACAWAGERRGG